MTALRIALFAAVWVVGGCSASSGGDKASEAPSPTSGSVQPSLTPASVQPSLVPASRPAVSPGTNGLPASITDPVVAEIARLAGVPVDQVTIVSAEMVTFPDGSLGCPVPGMAYTQVLVDGYKIVAEAGGRTYDFRGTGGSFRQCDPKVRPSASGS